MFFTIFGAFICIFSAFCVLFKVFFYILYYYNIQRQVVIESKLLVVNWSVETKRKIWIWLLDAEPAVEDTEFNNVKFFGFFLFVRPVVG